MERKFERLNPADAALVALETRRRLPIEIAALLVFDGAPPTRAALADHVRERLALVPRYRRRIVAVPFGAARPVWVEDADLRLAFHVREEALPGDAGERELASLVARILSTRLAPGRPLWEICLVERVAPSGFALIAKSHAALVDGRGHLDIAAALLDGAEAASPPLAAPAQAPAAASPSPRELLTTALAERARDPRAPLETLRAAVIAMREELERHDIRPISRIGAAPPSLLNAPIGADRRFAWAQSDLDRVRAAKERLGGTVNDCVLAAVAGAIRLHLEAAGEDPRGRVLRALVPLASGQTDGLVAAYAPLPIGIGDPRRRHAEIARALDGLQASGRAAPADAFGAQNGFAPTSVLGAAARLQTHQRGFNIAVTNVPGPQEPRQLLGRPLRAIYPAMPLSPRQTVAVSLVSYAGALCFGVTSDARAFPDPTALASGVVQGLAELEAR
jgi:WS/DGAT/MGAT family acyltransferase